MEYRYHNLADLDYLDLQSQRGISEQVKLPDVGQVQGPAGCRGGQPQPQRGGAQRGRGGGAEGGGCGVQGEESGHGAEIRVSLIQSVLLQNYLSYKEV